MRLINCFRLVQECTFLPNIFRVMTFPEYCLLFPYKPLIQTGAPENVQRALSKRVLGPSSIMPYKDSFIAVKL